MAELIIRKTGAVGFIIFSNQEKMNAMTFEMWANLPAAMQAFDADPAVRVIVVAGDGEKAFISGADISQFDKLRGTADAQESRGLGDVYKRQVQHLEAIGRVTHPTLGELALLNQSIKLTRTPSQIVASSPLRGQHTAEILTELGYDSAMIDSLTKNAII